MGEYHWERLESAVREFLELSPGRELMYEYLRRSLFVLGWEVYIQCRE